MRNLTILFSFIFAISLASCSAGGGGGDSPTTGNGGDGHEKRDVDLSQALSAEPWVGSWESDSGVILMLSSQPVSISRGEGVGFSSDFKDKLTGGGLYIMNPHCTITFRGEAWSNSLPSTSFQKSELNVWFSSIESQSEECGNLSLQGTIKWRFTGINDKLQLTADFTGLNKTFGDEFESGRVTHFFAVKYDF